MIKNTPAKTPAKRSKIPSMVGILNFFIIFYKPDEALDVATGAVVGVGICITGAWGVTAGALTATGISESGIKIADSIFWITPVLSIGFSGFKISSGTSVAGFTVTDL